jgi:branched-chain amino acid transport system ATP-binding protein
MTEPLLELEDVTKHFGGVVANEGVTFSIEQGEIVGLIGHNGAGKTTLFNIIGGYLKPDMGRITFQGEDITGLTPARIARKGVVRTFQATTLFNRMTVYQNVSLAHYLSIKKPFWSYILNTRGVRSSEREIHRRTESLIELFNLSEFHNVPAQSLPYGLQKCVGVAIAMAAKPVLLMLDEPVAGMNETESKEMTYHIRRIKDSGVTLLIIEHDMKTLMSITNRVVAMAWGQKLAEGTPSEIQRNESVIESYLGKDEDW